MSFPPPPGIAGSSAAQSHPTLPARPPPAKSSGGFKPAFTGASTTSANFKTTAAPSYHTAPSHAPGTTPVTRQYGGYPPYSGAPAASAMSAAPHRAQAQAYQYPPAAYPVTGYGSTPGVAGYSAPPSRTPHASAATGNDLDPDMAAQYAQWQSAYVPRDAQTSAPTKDAASGGRGGPTVGPTDPADAYKAAANANVDPAAKPERKTTVVRQGGGKKWTDDTLLEWDPSHPRLFVGNLAGEVTDDSLLKAFSRWKSVVKARVVRDKRTSKSKNYGFVSFSDPDDYFQAAKEMNGKYIQSHPVIVTRAKTEIKPTAIKEKDKGKKGGQKAKKTEKSHEPALGPMPGAGVKKSGQKTKNGLKLLG